jgi:hypothetical protein
MSTSTAELYLDEKGKPKHGIKIIPMVHEPAPKLDEKMKETLLKVANLRLALIAKEMEEIQPEYQKEKEFFEEAKAKFEEWQSRWDNLEAEELEVNRLIQRFVHKENKPYVPAHKNKGRKICNRIDWLGEAEAILKVQDRFMQPIEIWNIVIEQPNVKEQMKLMKSVQNNITSVRNATMTTWIKHATMYKDDAAKTAYFKGRLTIYNNLLGLTQWVDQKNIPKPNYMKPFMFGDVKMKVD